jgi:hypothetical protein
MINMNAGGIPGKFYERRLAFSSSQFYEYIGMIKDKILPMNDVCSLEGIAVERLFNADCCGSGAEMCVYCLN